MNKNGKFRKKKIYFTQVSNIAIKDQNLSLKAKGLYTLIQSYLTLENFTLYKVTLKKDCLEGEKAFENAWKELKDKGYLIQYKLKNDNGQFYYEYELLDTPLENKSEKEIEQKNHPPKKECMDNIQYGKESMWKTGVYNNTNLNNTNLNNTNLNNNLSSNRNKKELTEEDLKEKIIKLKEETLGSFKYYDYKKLIKTANGDIDLILYVYENILNIASNENPIKNLVAYMLKSIENELK